MIKLEKVSKIYFQGEIKIHALKNIDLHIKKGDFISIMGPSGSGKSTMLHLAGVLDHQTSGNIIINGVNVAKMSDEKRTEFRLSEIGFVFQFYSLLPELNAIENVFLPSMLYKKTGVTKESRARAKELLEKLGLGERLYNYPHQLSGGEQQRVTIARALINSPKIILADEPTAALDSKNAVNVINVLKKLNEETNQTIVLITHEEYLGKQAQNGIWLKDGVIEKESSF
jgi:putative ABC transport system ATP-binding protein